MGNVEVMPFETRRDRVGTAVEKCWVSIVSLCEEGIDVAIRPVINGKPRLLCVETEVRGSGEVLCDPYVKMRRRFGVSYEVSIG